MSSKKKNKKKNGVFKKKKKKIINGVFKKKKKKKNFFYLSRHTARERLEHKEKLLGLWRSRACTLSYSTTVDMTGYLFIFYLYSFFVLYFVFCIFFLSF